MPSTLDLIELTRICLKQARVTDDTQVTTLLREMAEDFQRRATQIQPATASSVSERQ
jgi:hypothetical protein